MPKKIENIAAEYLINFGGTALGLMMVGFGAWGLYTDYEIAHNIYGLAHIAEALVFLGPHILQYAIIFSGGVLASLKFGGELMMLSGRQSDS